MKIPSASLNGGQDRETFYWELVQKCMCSLPDRTPNYGMLRNYYLYGTFDGAQTAFNKIYPHIDLLTSFLFSIDTTRFSVQLDADANEEEVNKLAKATKAVNEAWHKGNADVVFNTGLTWSLVYNTMQIKLVVSQGGVLTYHALEPLCFGVLREDLPYNDRQEALCQSYFITKDELERRLHNHPNKKRIMENMEAQQQDLSHELPQAVSRIILSASNPTMQGNITIDQADNDYIPRVMEPLIKMYELWVWNDEINDYQTVTIADNGGIVYDRKNIFIEGEHPFVQVCPNPLYNYYWGESEVQKLIGLQSWRSERMDDIDDLFKKQAKPPTALTGIWGIQDEQNLALNYASGLLKSTDPTAKVERFAPTFPPESFTILHEIDAMFAEASGLGNMMMGKGEAGVRSKGHADTLARIGSSRAKKRALIVEDALEKIADLTLMCLKKYDKTRYLDDDGMPFILNQLTEKCCVKVDAHSSSPIYIEDYRDMIGELFQMGAIDRRSAIEMMHPPMEPILLDRLKKIEEDEKNAAQAEQAAQAQGSKK